MAIESPKYKTVHQDNKFEIREYEEHIEEGKKYRIAFTMPPKYTLENLPEPANKTISFRKVAKHRVASLRFSVNLNSKLATRKAKDLETWLVANKYPRKNNLIIAQYNPPWIPGIFRRNEVLTDV